MSISNTAAARWPRLLGWVAVSLLAHGVGLPALGLALRSLGWLGTSPTAQAMTPVRLDVFDPPPPQRPPPPEPQEPAPEAPTAAEPPPPEPEPAPPRPRRLRARAEPPPPPNQPAPPEPAQPPAPLDLSGVTLTGGASSFAVAAGDGSERAGPIAAPHPPRTPRSADSQPRSSSGAARGAGGRLVRAADLSRAPTATQASRRSLERCLLDRYPEQARRRGDQARIDASLRVGLDGAVERVRLLPSPADPAFSSACRACLERLPAFSAPLDRDGEPVTTTLRAFCDFRVR